MEVSVTVDDSAEYRGTVLGTDPVRDLAVIRICCGSFRTLSFGDASELEPGDGVVAIGYALGLLGEASITRGIVSAIRYDSNHLSDVIQTDAAINPGNSGGPMLSMTGQIVGVNTYRIDESSSGRTAEGLGFAISATTLLQRLPVLKETRAAPAPTLSWINPLPSPDGSFGPIDGELRHDPADALIKVKSAKDFMDNMIVEATFVNPYSGDSNDWDYGFIFREERGGPRIHLVVTSNKRWDLQWRETPSADTAHRLSSGNLHNFDTSAGGRNHLRVFATEERGWLFVNGVFVSTLDLSAVTGAGDILIITGAFTGNQVAGAVTRYEDFQGNLLSKAYGPASGMLESNPEYLSFHSGGVRARDFVVEAEFLEKSRFGFRDYGFAIRNSEFNRLEIIYLFIGDDGATWGHSTREPDDEYYTDVAYPINPAFRGYMLPDLDSKNHLLIIAIEESGWFFVNGHLVTKLDFSHNLDSGWVGVASSFASTTGGSPSFTNFNIWTP